MKAPTFNFTHLWNDLPEDERLRLMPHMIEAQILHIHQCKSKAIRAHKVLIDSLNDQIKNLSRALPEHK